MNIPLELTEAEAWALLTATSRFGVDAAMALEHIQARLAQTVKDKGGSLLIDATALTMRNDWPTGKGYVYFLTTATGRQALDRGDGAPVKVGKCAKPGVRLLSLQSGAPEPLEYIRLIPAANSDQAEREMHSRFKDRRLHHEWFSLTLADIRGAAAAVAP